MDKRAYVVLRRGGDSEMSMQMMQSLVAPEIKRITAQRDLLAWGKSQTVEDRIRELREAHEPKPVGRIRRVIEQTVGLLVMLNQWRHAQRSRA